MTAKDTMFRRLTAFHRAVFMASKGRVAGRGMGMPVLVLATVGRTTGQRRETMLTTPLVIGETVVIVASYGGDDREPAWCRNLRVNPEVDVTMSGRTRAMIAHVADSTERAELWPQITAAHANYAGYQRKTDREIPVVVLSPAGESR
jgi:deazaflavin-dependent oxidoreductase (nitroreductase family)